MLTRTFTISLAILSLTAGRDLASRAATEATVVALPHPVHRAPVGDLDGCREEVAPAPRTPVVPASSCGEPRSVAR